MPSRSPSEAASSGSLRSNPLAISNESGMPSTSVSRKSTTSRNVCEFVPPSSSVTTMVIWCPPAKPTAGVPETTPVPGTTVTQPGVVPEVDHVSTSLVPGSVAVAE